MYLRKETYICEKRHTFANRDMYLREETYICEKRHSFAKRDIHFNHKFFGNMYCADDMYLRKETYICGKRHIYLRKETYNLRCYCILCLFLQMYCIVCVFPQTRKHTNNWDIYLCFFLQMHCIVCLSANAKAHKQLRTYISVSFCKYIVLCVSIRKRERIQTIETCILRRLSEVIEYFNGLLLISGLLATIKINTGNYNKYSPVITEETNYWITSNYCRQLQ